VEVLNGEEPLQLTPSPPQVSLECLKFRAKKGKNQKKNQILLSSALGCGFLLFHTRTKKKTNKML
jgi:hypothetical protein